MTFGRVPFSLLTFSFCVVLPLLPVQNPKTHSRFLEYQRVMEDNHRLVGRLLQTRSFVNERGSWDDHALEHEETLLRLSHNPKNCFIPQLHAERRRVQKRLRAQSVAAQARERLLAAQSPRAAAAAQLERVRAVVDSAGVSVPAEWGSGFEDSSSSSARGAHSDVPRYTYPLPPPGVDGVGPPLVLPRGTHLVAPALLDADQYDALSRQLAGVDLNAAADEMHAQAPQAGASTARGRPRGRVYATTGDLSDSMLTLPMPPASAPADASAAAEEASQPTVFYLRPRAHRPRTASPGDARVAEAAPVPYPFRFPPLETREGDPLAPPPPPPHAINQHDGLEQPLSVESEAAYQDPSQVPQQQQPLPPSHRAGGTGLNHAPSQKFIDYFHERSAALLGSSVGVSAVPSVARSGRTARLRRPPARLPVMTAQTARMPAPPQPPQPAHASSHTPPPYASSSSRSHAFHSHHESPSAFSLGRGGSARLPTQRALEGAIERLLDAEATGTESNTDSRRASRRARPPPPLLPRTTSRKREEEKQTDAEREHA